MATLTLVIFQTTVIFFQRRLLSSNIYFSIGNDWKPTTRLRLHYPHFIPGLRRKYYVRQFELYLATFARATSSALGQCSPVALPPHLLSQHRPPTIRKPESYFETETATSSSCQVVSPSNNKFNFSTSPLPPAPAGQQSAWQAISHPDFRLPALCLTTCNQPISR